MAKHSILCNFKCKIYSFLLQENKIYFEYHAIILDAALIKMIFLQLTICIYLNRTELFYIFTLLLYGRFTNWKTAHCIIIILPKFFSVGNGYRSTQLKCALNLQVICTKNMLFGH